MRRRKNNTKELDNIKHPEKKVSTKDYASMNLVVIAGLRNTIALSRAFGVPIFVYEGLKPLFGDCEDNLKNTFSSKCEMNSFCILACTFLGSGLLYALDVLLCSVENRLKGKDPSALKVELTLQGLDSDTQRKLIEAQNKGNLAISVALK